MAGQPRPRADSAVVGRVSGGGGGGYRELGAGTHEKATWRGSRGGRGRRVSFSRRGRTQKSLGIDGDPLRRGKKGSAFFCSQRC